MNIKGLIKDCKVDFWEAFLLCIFVMIIDQVMKYLDYLPPLLNKDNFDYIFHILQSFISICSQLSASIAAAIVFYYATEYIYAKKNLIELNEIMEYIIQILFVHRDIIEHIDTFNEFKTKYPIEKSIKGHIFIQEEAFMEMKNIFFKCDKDKLKNELKGYFNEQSSETKRNLLEKFDCIVTEVCKNKNKSFYKGYNNDLKGLMTYLCRIKKCIENNESVVDEYEEFLQQSIKIFYGMNEFIKSIEEKNIKKFIIMN